MVGPGKLEAYFFPPIDVPPYNLTLAGPVITRLGVRADVPRDAVLAAIHDFGVNDSLYAMLNRWGRGARRPETWSPSRLVQVCLCGSGFGVFARCVQTQHVQTQRFCRCGVPHCRFDVSPFEGWTIDTGVIHAPGPYPTVSCWSSPKPAFLFFCLRE